MIARYSRPAMKRVWSEESKLERWLEVELAALDAWAESAPFPPRRRRPIRERAVPPTPERVAEIEERTQHDLAAFVDAVAEQARDATARWLHYGLTSSDVLDTATALQVREAGALLLVQLDRALEAVVRRAEEHRETVMAGRTHGVHAEPITFGAKLAGWAFELDRDRERLARALEGMRVGKLAGAVGTYGGGDPEVERLACERLGLVPGAGGDPGRPPRPPRRAPLRARPLRRVPGALRHRDPPPRPNGGARGARALRPAARRAPRRCRTSATRSSPSASAGSHGSSARRRAVGLENVALWHERDISHSSAERVVLPDAFLALDYMLDRFAWIVDGLVVDAARMRENLEASHGLVFSQRVLSALVAAGLERDAAYRLVQRNALRAWDEKRDFRALLRDDPEVAARLDETALARGLRPRRRPPPRRCRLRAPDRSDQPTKEAVHA